LPPSPSFANKVSAIQWELLPQLKRSSSVKKWWKSRSDWPIRARQFELFCCTHHLAKKGKLPWLEWRNNSLGSVFWYSGRNSTSLFTTNSVCKISPKFRYKHCNI
jgi:hypothetical protein